MNKQKTIKISSQLFIGFSIFSIGYVSIVSLINPASTMDLVAISLTNNDAISSIRGIYGGVGMVITLCLLFWLLKNQKHGIVFLILFWGVYALSRLITIVVDGPLGDFGNQWLMIEFVLCFLAAILLLLNKRHTIRKS